MGGGPGVGQALRPKGLRIWLGPFLGFAQLLSWGLDNPVGYSCWPVLGPPHQQPPASHLWREGLSSGVRCLWPQAESLVGSLSSQPPPYPSPTPPAAELGPNQPTLMQWDILRVHCLGQLRGGSSCPHPPGALLSLAPRGLSFVCPSPTPFPASHLEHPDPPQAPLNSRFLRGRVDGVPTLHQVLASPAQL